MKRRLLFLLAMTFVMFIAVAAQAQRATVRCESSNNHYRECTFNGFGSVALGRQLSSVACQEGRSWGVKNDNTIWVNNGCRADFYVMQRGNRNGNGYGRGSMNGMSPNDRRLDRRDARQAMRGRSVMVVCESQNNRRNRCNTDAFTSAEINRQMSSGSCRQGRDWGYDANGIWVDHGCRAEFRVSR